MLKQKIIIIAILLIIIIGFFIFIFHRNKPSSQYRLKIFYLYQRRNDTIFILRVSISREKIISIQNFLEEGIPIFKGTHYYIITGKQLTPVKNVNRKDHYICTVFPKDITSIKDEIKGKIVINSMDQISTFDGGFRKGEISPGIINLSPFF